MAIVNVMLKASWRGTWSYTAVRFPDPVFDGFFISENCLQKIMSVSKKIKSPDEKTFSRDDKIKSGNEKTFSCADITFTSGDIIFSFHDQTFASLDIIFWFFDKIMLCADIIFTTAKRPFRAMTR